MALASLAEGRRSLSTESSEGKREGWDSRWPGGFAPEPPFDPHHSQQAGPAFLFVDKPRASKRLRGFGAQTGCSFTLPGTKAPKPDLSSQDGPSPAHLLSRSTEMQDLGDTGLNRRTAGSAVFSENLTWKPRPRRVQVSPEAKRILSQQVQSDKAALMA